MLHGLFLDSLHEEFERIRHDLRALRTFSDKLATIKLFDPACGCGNFLVIAYRELRRLELKAIQRTTELDPQGVSDLTILCKVDVNQLTGIEIEENPAAIAEVATWITDHQMNQEVSDTFGRSLSRLPLTRSARILRCNALELDWRTLFAPEDISTGRLFIFGNPPFVAKANRNASQNRDQQRVWAQIRGAGVLDYVTCWFVKAAQMMEGSRVRVAFVATNSITQGEQIGVLCDTFTFAKDANFLPPSNVQVAKRSTASSGCLLRYHRLFNAGTSSPSESSNTKLPTVMPLNDV